MRYPAILAAAALSAAMAFAVPAAAEDSASVEVKYADLDLSTSAGKAKLERRIDSAVRSACGMDQVRTGRLTPSTAARECYQQTKASVGQQVAQRIARDNTRG
jgi:UrcA family protein